MARKNNKKKSNYRARKGAIKVLGLAEAAVIANASTRFFFDTSAWEFFTKGWFDKGVKGGSTKTGAYGHTWELTLHELIMNPGGTWGGNATSLKNMGGLGGTIKRNMKANMAAGATMLLAPVGFRFLRKVMRKPIRVSNKILADVAGKNVIKI
jgi:hypothetical protein